VKWLEGGGNWGERGGLVKGQISLKKERDFEDKKEPSHKKFHKEEVSS